MARRDNREYRTYLRAEQRRQRGCIARRMQRHLHHGLLGEAGLHCTCFVPDTQVLSGFGDLRALDQA